MGIYVNGKLIAGTRGHSSGITEAQVDAKISAAINDLIDGAPAAYDTLKEISDYIATDKNAAEAMELAISDKVDKTTTVNGKPLSENITLNASDVNALPSSTNITAIETLTEAEYSALTTKNATTLYLIKE